MQRKNQQGEEIYSFGFDRNYVGPSTPPHTPTLEHIVHHYVNLEESTREDLKSIPIKVESDNFYRKHMSHFKIEKIDEKYTLSFFWNNKFIDSISIIADNIERINYVTVEQAIYLLGDFDGSSIPNCHFPFQVNHIYYYV